MAELAAQANQFLTLGAAQTFLAWYGFATITRILRNSIGDALGGRAKLTREFGRRPTSVCQFDDLLTKLRRIWRL